MHPRIVSTISSMLPENGVRSHRPVWRLTLKPSVEADRRVSRHTDLVQLAISSDTP